MSHPASDTPKAHLSPGSWFVLGGGTAILAMGALVFILASPSPHGYIELFFAVPTMSVGAAIVAFGLLMSRRRLTRPIRLFAWFVLFAALVPLASVIHLMVSTRP